MSTSLQQIDGGEMDQSPELEDDGLVAFLPWPHPLRFGTLDGRENRFVLRCRAPEPVRAFLANTGRMEELLVPGATIGMLPANRQGATAWDASIVRYGEHWVAIDNRLTERVVAQALNTERLPGWAGLGPWRREVALGRHRFDFAADGPSAAWLEVKASNLVIDGIARFPGAPSVRAVAHLRLLAERARLGERAGLLIVVARADARGFAPHDERDPDFGAALREAIAAGVSLQALPCAVDEAGIRLYGRELPVWL